MSKVDRNEAPEGYYAEGLGDEGEGCEDCAFCSCNGGACLNLNACCESNLRKDGMSVIFKKKEEAAAMSKVNPNEAPEGYYAEECSENDDCGDCAFFLKEYGTCRDRRLCCLPGGRKDGMSVIFKKKEEAAAMSKVDRDEAPEGYYAEAMSACKEGDDYHVPCDGCAFYSYNGEVCLRDSACCESNLRKDGMSVIFKKKPDAEKQDPSQHEPGAKLDNGKPRVGLMFETFPHALWKVAELVTYGAEHYSPKGCLLVEDGENRYFDAHGRHLLKRCMNLGPNGEEPCDPESKALELAAIAWNALIKLELHVRNNGGIDANL